LRISKPTPITVAAVAAPSSTAFAVDKREWETIVEKQQLVNNPVIVAFLFGLWWLWGYGRMMQERGKSIVRAVSTDVGRPVEIQIPGF
jgi:hypothetical protein